MPRELARIEVRRLYDTPFVRGNKWETVLFSPAGVDIFKRQDADKEKAILGSLETAEGMHWDVRDIEDVYLYTAGELDLLLQAVDNYASICMRKQRHVKSWFAPVISIYSKKAHITVKAAREHLEKLLVN